MSAGSLGGDRGGGRTRGTPASQGAEVDESSVSVGAAGGAGVAEGPSKCLLLMLKVALVL